MVKLTGSLEGNFIKTCYNDLEISDLLKIKEATPRGILAALSDIPPAKLRALDSEDVLALYELVSFLVDPVEAMAAVPLTIQLPEVDVAASTFEKAELAKMRIDKLKEPYRLFPELVRIYFGEEHLTGPAINCLALGAIIFQDLNKLFNRFKDLAGEAPSEEQIEAGIEALHTFGPYGMAESIASKYGCKPYDVFQWSAEEVYLELTYQQAKSHYQDNLREIEKRKTPKK